MGRQRASVGTIAMGVVAAIAGLTLVSPATSAGGASASTALHFYSRATVAEYVQSDGQPTATGAAPDVGGFFFIIGPVFRGTHSHHAKAASGTADIVCTLTATLSGYCDGSIAIGDSAIAAQHAPETFSNGGFAPLELTNGTGRFADDSGFATIIPVGTGTASDITITVHETGVLGIDFAAPPEPVNGAYIDQVEKGGPAAKAGIASGSVITSVAGQSVSSGFALQLALDAHKPGDSLAVSWTDPNGQTHSATVKLQ